MTLLTLFSGGAAATFNEVMSGGILAGSSATVQATYGPATAAAGNLASGSGDSSCAYHPTIDPAGLLAGGTATFTYNVVPASAGIVADGTAALTVSYTVSPSFGVWASGQGNVVETINQPVIGAGALLAGTGTDRETDNPSLSSSGVLVNGAALVAVIYKPTASSGVLGSGSGDTSGTTYNASVVSAGILCNGSASVAFAYLVSGGVLAAGSAGSFVAFNPALDGIGLLAGGGINNVISIVGSGGLLADGSVANAAIFNPLASGTGSMASGTALLQAVYAVTASSGLLASGLGVSQAMYAANTVGAGLLGSGFPTIQGIYSVTPSPSGSVIGGASPGQYIGSVMSGGGALQGTSALVSMDYLVVADAHGLNLNGLADVSSAVTGGAFASGQAGVVIVAGPDVGGGLLVGGVAALGLISDIISANDGPLLGGSGAVTEAIAIMPSGCVTNGSGVVAVVAGGRVLGGPAFSIGDILYNIHKARRGRLERVVIKSIRPVYARRPAANKFLYVDTLNGLWNEYDLVRCSDATAMAGAYYQHRLDELDSLRC